MPQHPPIFQVATKAMIIKDNKLLILYKSKEEAKEWSSTSDANNTNHEARRDLPGGRLNFGEAPTTALIREVHEEVGLSINIIQPIDTWHIIKDNLQLVGINYLCQWTSGEVTLSPEHEAYEWLTQKELQAKNWNDLEKYLPAFQID